MPADRSGAPAGSAKAWTPSARLTAALAGAMLAVGIGVGGAIGPAPEASFAGASRLPLLLPSLIERATAAGAAKSASTQPPAITATATPRARRQRRHAHRALGAAATGESASPVETPGSSSSKTKANSEPAKTTPLPPISKVWIIELSGSTFGEALATPSSAPYITSKAVAAGALLSGWSSLQASAFASDTALLATTEAQLAETVLEPPCPEGAAGAQCAQGTPGALKTADEFLSQTVPAITSGTAYRTSGLIVVTFASTAAGAAGGLPTGSTTATLSSRPPSGALLLSPFVTAGARPSTAFNPSSPRRSMEALLHR